MRSVISWSALPDASSAKPSPLDIGGCLSPREWEGLTLDRPYNISAQFLALPEDAITFSFARRGILLTLLRLRRTWSIQASSHAYTPFTKSKALAAEEQQGSRQESQLIGRE